MRTGQFRSVPYPYSNGSFSVYFILFRSEYMSKKSELKKKIRDSEKEIEALEAKTYAFQRGCYGRDYQ